MTKFSCNDEPAFAITMLVTTVVVADGTVYSVVLDVAAAVLASAFEVTAISYCPSFLVSAHYYHDFIGCC